MKKRPTETIERLLSSKSVALLMHINPDWDCLGSCLALQSVLRRNGVVCDIIADEPLSGQLSIFDSEIVVYEGGELGYDCLCSVDVGDGNRMGRRAEAFAAHGNTVCIDHHQGDGSFAGISYVDSHAPATGEIIFDMLKSIGMDITVQEGEYLYCAISSDTGSFKYADTTAHTMEVAAEIMRLGINSAALCEQLYERKSFRQLKLTGEAIATMELHCGGKIGTAYVTGEMYKKYDATKNDTDHLSSLPREIDTVVMSAFLTQRTPDEIRVNLRSKGDYDVSKAAAAFGGGGHMRAAGCTIEGSDMDAAIKAIVSELEKQIN